MTLPNRYNRRDLVDAWLARRGGRDAHPDLSDFAERRYTALSTALGADLDRVPDHQADRALVERGLAEAAALSERWGRHIMEDTNLSTFEALHGLFESVASQVDGLASPFDNFLEAPPIFLALFEAHGVALKSATGDLREELQSLLVSLAGIIWGLPLDRGVTVDDLRAVGFDPKMSPPDPIDYL